jgi:hypothetical protein
MEGLCVDLACRFESLAHNRLERKRPFLSVAWQQKREPLAGSPYLKLSAARYAMASFATFTISANVSRSLTARSARIFRSSATSASFSPWMNRL